MYHSVTYHLSQLQTLEKNFYSIKIKGYLNFLSIPIFILTKLIKSVLYFYKILNLIVSIQLKGDKVMNSTTKSLVQTALALAIVTVCTMVFTAPIPGTQGYVNLGDTMIFTFAIILGKKKGALVGGLGAGLADILLGAVMYAPATLVIKALEGFACGLIYEKLKEKGSILATLMACLVGAFIMIVGYFGYDSILYGIEGAVASALFNVVQGIGSMILALLVSKALCKAVEKLTHHTAA